MSGRILASIVDIIVSEIVAHLLSSAAVCAVQKVAIASAEVCKARPYKNDATHAF